MPATVILVAYGDYSSVVNPTLTVLNTVPAGSIVIVSKVSNSAQTNFTSVSDSKGNTYTLGTASAVTGSPAAALKQFYSVLTTGLVAGDTISTVSNGATRQAFLVEAITGLTASPRDGADVTAIGTGTAPSAGATGTLTQAQEVLYEVVGTAGSGIGAPAGWSLGGASITAVGTNERAIGSGYVSTSSTASTTPTFSLTTGNTWAAILSKFLINTTVSTGPKVKVWNGTGWVDKTAGVKVWNGSAWVVKTAKVWNGSAWV